MSTEMSFRRVAPEMQRFVRGKGPGKQFGRLLLNAGQFKEILNKHLSTNPRTDLQAWLEASDDLRVFAHYVETGNVITREEARRRFNAEWDAELASS
jgi:hypothetical protein